MAVHRVVKEYLHGARSFTAGDADVETLSEHINERARVAARAEAERERMLEADYMRGHIGEVHDARITRIRPFGLIVQLDVSGAGGVVPFETLPEGPYRTDPRETEAKSKAHTFTIGMALKVSITAADPALGRVEMAWVPHIAD